MAPCLRFLQPYAYQPLPAGASSRCSAAYLRFYELSKECRRNSSAASSKKAPKAQKAPAVDRSVFVESRIKELKAAGLLQYPRLSFSHKTATPRQFYAKFGKATQSTGGGLAEPVNPHTINGRVMYIRRFGSKFFFVQIVHDGESIQAMVNIAKLLDEPGQEKFNALASLLRRGDHISVTGQPARTDSGDFVIEAQFLPQILAPSIAPLPYQQGLDTKMQNRHLDLLLNKEARDRMVLRHHIINELRQYLSRTMGCTEVQTPIVSANAGGAVARPFNTQATEFSHKDLALRIAPELWLKRLVVGGMDKVYEIGPAFRNEGVDHTHNPEFTVCEFYHAYANLSYLTRTTEHLFASIADAVKKTIDKLNLQANPPDFDLFNGTKNLGHFDQVEFIPALSQAIGRPLPNLDSPTAVADIIQILEDEGKTWHKSLPPIPSLSKLLDHLASEIIEPQSMGRPLFIIHHPACMSPLSKTFQCPLTGQQVAARAELFFDGNELANMYEEENDPFEQRRKFAIQAEAKQEAKAEDEEEPPHVMDEQYISVLESGLPPTGGWGCGVDRLVMLFTGAKRISDVLPFGNLRNVVGLHSAGPQHQQDGEGETLEASMKAQIKKTRKLLEQSAESHLEPGKSRGAVLPQAKINSSPPKTSDNVI